MKPLFIAYYTVNTPYQDEAAKLRTNLEAMGLEVEMTAFSSLGSWQKNTQLKSRFVRDRIVAHRVRPLVYLDVDAEVLSPPTLLDELAETDCDIAAAKFGGHELLSGTVYFGAGPKVLEVVDRWVALCDQYPERIPGGLLPHFPRGDLAWDQRLLDVAIRQTPGVNFVELPPSYTFIFDLSRDRYPDVEPIILHSAASRRYRDAVNR